MSRQRFRLHSFITMSQAEGEMSCLHWLCLLNRRTTDTHGQACKYESVCTGLVLPVSETHRHAPNVTPLWGHLDNGCNVMSPTSSASCRSVLKGYGRCGPPQRSYVLQEILWLIKTWVSFVYLRPSVLMIMLYPPMSLISDFKTQKPSQK